MTAEYKVNFNLFTLKSIKILKKITSSCCYRHKITIGCGMGECLAAPAEKHLINRVLLRGQNQGQMYLARLLKCRDEWPACG